MIGKFMPGLREILIQGRRTHLHGPCGHFDACMANDAATTECSRCRIDRFNREHTTAAAPRQSAADERGRSQTDVGKSPTNVVPELASESPSHDCSVRLPQ